MFASSEAGGSFECRLDDGAWGACSSPKVLASLIDGPHTFEVRASDAVGNTDPSPAARSWTLDALPPDTVITAGPADRVKTTSASFQFAASETGGSFECRLDGGAWSYCASPKDHTGLAEGAHTFQARYTDPSGNTESSPASRTWTVDLTAPQTTIGSGPPAGVNGPSAAFGFSSSEVGSTFECRLDGGAWGACASPKSYAGLADGSRTFEVRAIDVAGNVDASPASRVWTVDAVAPATTIDAGPSGTVASASAVFGFSSEAGATFECRIDGGAYAACTSPKTYAGLVDGSHTFEVRAIDAVGNVDGSPASRTWTVDTTAPQTTIGSARRGR